MLSCRMVPLKSSFVGDNCHVLRDSDIALPSQKKVNLDKLEELSVASMSYTSLSSSSSTTTTTTPTFGSKSSLAANLCPSPQCPESVSTSRKISTKATSFLLSFVHHQQRLRLEWSLRKWRKKLRWAVLLATAPSLTSSLSSLALVIFRPKLRLRSCSHSTASPDSVSSISLIYIYSTH